MDGAGVRTFAAGLRLYSEALAGRKFIGMVGLQGDPIDAPTSTAHGLKATYPMRLVIQLSDGEWMVVETPSLMEWRFRRIPVGLFAGLFGILVSAFALWNVWNVVRPARDMAQAAERFSDTGKPHLVTPRGGTDMRGLVSAFNMLQERVAGLLANRTLIMSAMSHDVRTYLTRLRLRIEPLEPASRDAAERAINEIQALLDDTLAFAEADHSALDSGIPIELADWLLEFANSGQFSATELSTNVIGKPSIRANPSRLERALVNIISNAVKYGGGAELTLREDGRSAIIVVSDRGPGIPDADKDRVFDPFFRRDASRNRSTEGAGLGLAIAKTIIHRSGGEIRLSDRSGGGLDVTIRLPLNEDARAKEGRSGTTDLASA